MVVKALAIVLVLASPAAADELLLKNGAVLNGVVKEEGDRYILEVDFGTMSIPKSQVKSVRRSEDPIQEFEAKRVKAATAQEHFDVGLWARQKELHTRAGDMFKRAITLDPEHEGARKALGYEKFDGKWMTTDEAMVARGFVKHRGEWLKKETVEKFRSDEKELQIERERAATAERLAQLQKDVELARLAVERERIERERQESDALHYYRVSWVTMPCRCGRPDSHRQLHLPVAAPAPARSTAPPPFPKELPPLPAGPAPITPR